MLTTPDTAARLRSILTDPAPVLDAIVDMLADYWDTAFAAEWEWVEPALHGSIAVVGQQIAARGVLPMLQTLIPQIRIDPRRRLLRLDRPHAHDITLTSKQTVTFTASHYVWPHVRVTCDDPWPIRITYPSAPLAPTPAAASREEMLTALRALAAAPRLEIAAAIAAQSRSTQELASLLGLSESVVSRHLHQMAQAGLANSRRDGYYVLYSLDHRRLEAIVGTLTRLATTTG